MAKARNPWISIRGGLAPATGLLIVAFFAGYAIFGANGAIDIQNVTAGQDIVMSGPSLDIDNAAAARFMTLTSTAGDLVGGTLTSASNMTLNANQELRLGNATSTGGSRRPGTSTPTSRC